MLCLENFFHFRIVISLEKFFVCPENFFGLVSFFTYFFKQHPDSIVRNTYFYTKDNYSKFKENGTDFTLLIADTSMFVLNFMIE
jgi:hypothetical protein